MHYFPALKCSVPSQWAGNIVFPWLRALPFGSLSLLPHSSWLASLWLYWYKIWSLNLPRLFLSGSLCGYSLPARKTFSTSSHPWLCLIIRTSSPALLPQEALPGFPFEYVYAPRLLSLAHRPIPFRTYFLAFITIWNQSINQLIFLFSFVFTYQSPFPLPQLNWRRIFICVTHCCIFSA